MEEDEPSRAGPQSAVHRGDAAAERKAAGNSARRGLRDRLSLRRSPIGCGITPCRTSGRRDFGIQRWGFHGASHRYIAERTAKSPAASDLRIISCHLGGSSSLCAIRDGKSVATSMGMSPQSGCRRTIASAISIRLPCRSSCEQHRQVARPKCSTTLAERSGLLGLSGVSGDIRDLEQAAAGGNARARLALDVLYDGRAALSRGIPRRTGRRRGDRLHRRHRREQRERSGGRLPRSRRARHRARCGDQRRGRAAMPESTPPQAACSSGSCRPTKS